MIALNATSDYVVMIVVAALCGAIGGFGFELIQSRRITSAGITSAPAEGAVEESGSLQVPRWLANQSYYDLGFWAAVVVGAIAAVGTLYFLAPTVSITIEQANGASTTSLQYDLIKLIALSLLVGTAGQSVLTSMQARVLAAITAQKLDSKAKVAAKQIDLLKAASVDELRAALDKANATVASDSSGRGQARTPQRSGSADDDILVADFERAMSKRLEAAKEIVQVA